jgi:membrane protein implicated in regulation of membrane protease activity
MFIAIGIVGVLLLLVALLVDDIFDGLLPESDWLSTASIAAFLAAFGFGAGLLQRQVGLHPGLAAAGGAAAGVALAMVAVRWSRALSTMATDATPTSGDLLGCTGRVITAVPGGSSGEVMVRLGGQPVKLSAVGPDGGDAELSRGAEVIVVDVLSPTRVRVEPVDRFWSSP